MTNTRPNELLEESKELLAIDKYTADEHIQTELLPLLTMVEINTEKIREHSFSLTRIVRSMDKILQVNSNNFVEININSFIEDQLGIYTDEVDEAYRYIPLELNQALEHENLLVKISPAEISSVIFNILNNSMYSLHERTLLDTGFKPRIIISTALKEEDVEIRIQDNGKGMSEVEKQQLFSPFFTTKPTSKGTGLGLFISHNIIKTHKGNISVDTKQNSSTTFIIKLPLSTSPLS